MTNPVYGSALSKRGFSGRSFRLLPQWGTVDAELRPPPSPLVGGQDYHRFTRFKPGVVISPCIASSLLISAFPVHSTSFSPKKFSNKKRNVWNCVVSMEMSFNYFQKSFAALVVQKLNGHRMSQSKFNAKQTPVNPNGTHL